MTAETAGQPPLISVIVPTFNDGPHLAEALASIARQGRGDMEVIVVDDGSDPPVEAEVARLLPSAKLIRQANAGPSAARNRGIEAARGQFVTFLDADDIWAEDAIARFVATFADAPGADAVHGYLRRFRTDAEGREERSPIYCSFHVGTLMVRRDVLLATGLFDEALRRSEDVDLFLKLRDAGARRVVIPDLLLHYRCREREEAPVGHALKPGENGNWLPLLQRSLRRKRSVPATAKPVASSEPVTVILTVRDGMTYLPAGLASLRRQTVAPAEIVACVGPSSDGTLEYLGAQPDVRVHEQSGTGLANARNEALSTATHPWFAFFDHDDLWHPEKLAKQIEAVSMFRRPSACIVNFLDIAGDAVADGEVVRPSRGLPSLGWTPSALLAHRDVFGKVGPFDPTLGMGCDTDWFDRLRRSETPCTVAGRVMLWKRRHETNLSSDPSRNREAMFKVIRKRRLAQKSGSV
ncbi:MAG: glycosyltransferase family A protein [Pseudomonadota bacterium]